MSYVPPHLRRLRGDLNMNQPIQIWNVNTIASFVPDDNRPHKNNMDDKVLTRNPIEIFCRGVIASYNWDNESETPKILVPGAPKLFYKWPGGELPKGVGREASKDRNLDAMFTAIRVLNREFKLSDYGIAANMEVIASLFAISFRAVKAILEKSDHWKLDAVEINMNATNLQKKQRIDVELVGSTVLMVSQKPEFAYGLGCGIAFRKKCAETPLAAMLREGLLDEKLLNGVYKMVRGMEIGDLKILLADEVDAACYPVEEELGTGVSVNVPLHLERNVFVGGYKGDLNRLTPIALATFDAEIEKLMVPTKYLTQYFSNSPSRYVGRDEEGVIEKPKSHDLEEIRNLCGLDESGADLWIKVLICILNEIVSFAKNQGNRKFAIISDPRKGQLRFYRYVRAEPKVVSANTLNYLVSTLEME